MPTILPIKVAIRVRVLLTSKLMTLSRFAVRWPTSEFPESNAHATEVMASVKCGPGEPVNCECRFSHPEEVRQACVLK